MATKSPTISCSATEATFLASLLGGHMLLGIQDPFVGWLTEEIQETWEEAKQALTKRNFLEVAPDGGVVIDTAVAAMVGTWANPDASFLLTYTTEDKKTDTRYFHLTRYLGVEQNVTAKPNYQLTALENAQALYNRILELLHLENQVAAPGSKSTLREEFLRQVGGKSKSKTTATEALKRAGLDEPTSNSLAKTLVKPIANGALVALARRTTSWEIGGLGILEGKNGLWRLRSFVRDGENWVEAIPCDALQAREDVRRVMNRVLPEPLPAQ